MNAETEKRLRRMISRIIENVHSDLHEAVTSCDPSATLEAEDFIEPVYNHLITDTVREFGVSSDVHSRVCKFDRGISEIIRDEARKIVGV